MYKKVNFLIFVTIITTSFGMVTNDPDKNNTETPATSESTQSPSETAKAAIEKELKKNKGKLKKFKDNAKLAPAIAKIESIINKIVTSSQFKAIIEKMTTQQAQDIAQGKTFSEIKYSHSLTTEFPKLTNPNKLLVEIYNLMANIEHNQLLLSKIGETTATTSSTQTTQPPLEITDVTQPAVEA